MLACRAHVNEEYRYSPEIQQHMKTTLSILLFLLVGISGSQAQALTGAPVVVVRAERMLDVRTGSYVSNPVIVLDGERIKAMGPNLPIPPGAKILDLGNVTLLPGLIDCHTHLLQNYVPRFFDGNNMVLTVAGMSTAKRALLGARMGREDLEAGITTVRDVGNSGLNGAIALRDAIDSGWVTGPRIVACGRALAPTGGQFPSVVPEAQNLIEQEYVTVNGPDEARKAVRQSLYDGADCIKVIVDNGPVTLSLEEMKAIVEEAHRLGKKVAAHAIAEQAVTNAALAGVDSIEHAYALSDDQAKLMAIKGIFLVPTDAAPVEVYLAGVPRTPEEQKESLAGFTWFAQRSRKRLAMAVKDGVHIAAGSDAYNDKPGMTRGQCSLTMLTAYAESGMSPLEIIRTATLNAADLIGLLHDVGSLEAGKYADVIAVSGDPLHDVDTLQHVCFVMKGGSVVKNDPPGSGEKQVSAAR